MFDNKQFDNETKYILEHLRKFQLQDLFMWDLYWGLNTTLFVVSILFLISAIHELFLTLTTLPTVILLLIVFSATLLMTGTELLKFVRGRRLSSLKDPSDIWTFLQKHGNLVDAKIVSTRGRQKTIITYKFPHKERYYGGEYPTLNNGEKKKQALKVLHWEGIIHAPILDVEN